MVLVCMQAEDASCWLSVSLMMTSFALLSQHSSRETTLFSKHGHVVFAKTGVFIPVWEDGAERQGREGNSWQGGGGPGAGVTPPSLRPLDSHMPAPGWAHPCPVQTECGSL